MRFFAVYSTCVRTAVSRAVAYRADFFLSVFVTFAGNLGLPLVSLLIYSAGAEFPGWTFPEVLLIQSIYTMSQAIAMVGLGDMMWVTMQHVREGSFETVLLKPLNPLTYIIATTFSTDAFGKLLCALALLGYALAHVAIASWTSVLAGLLLFVGGVAVQAGSKLILAAVSFKWVGNSRLPEIFDSVEGFGQYPITIFPRAIQAVMSFVIPVSLVGFFPAAALLGRVEPVAFIAAGFCLLFLGFGVWLYQHMIRLYKSAGG